MVKVWIFIKIRWTFGKIIFENHWIYLTDGWRNLYIYTFVDRPKSDTLLPLGFVGSRQHIFGKKSMHLRYCFSFCPRPLRKAPTHPFSQATPPPKKKITIFVLSFTEIPDGVSSVNGLVVTPGGGGGEFDNTASELIPLYCAIMGAVIIAVIIYVVIKHWRRRKLNKAARKASLDGEAPPIQGSDSGVIIEQQNNAQGRRCFLDRSWKFYRLYR